MADAWRTTGAEVRAAAETFWLELGDLREIVKKADALDMSDKADVLVKGLTKSYVEVDQCHFSELTVREQTYKKEVADDA